MDPILHHGARQMTPIEAKNRKYICSIMEKRGFARYAYEWWHYTLKGEPHSDVYFDFPVT
jgi:D-alanyl-D-alanine dipeptidase